MILFESSRNEYKSVFMVFISIIGNSFPFTVCVCMCVCVSTYTNARMSCLAQRKVNLHSSNINAVRERA